MNASRKRLARDGGIEDIICGLPAHVLDIILKRLPHEDVVRTSILSRKWRYLWSQFPYLVFDKLFFELIFANKPNSASKYVNVINKILYAHHGPVLNFSLFIPDINFGWDEEIDNWLLFLSRNGIKQLSLDNQQNLNLYKLPSYVFSSSDLTHLKLKNTIFKPLVSFSGYANMVELSFENVTFARWEFNNSPSIALLLSKLTFIKCVGIRNFKIYAPRRDINNL